MVERVKRVFQSRGWKKRSCLMVDKEIFSALVTGLLEDEVFTRIGDEIPRNQCLPLNNFDSQL